MCLLFLIMFVNLFLEGMFVCVCVCVHAHAHMCVSVFVSVSLMLVVKYNRYYLMNSTEFYQNIV